MSQELKVSSVLGNRQKLDGGAMFGNVPRAMWEKWHAPDDHGRIELNCRCALVEFEQTKVLLETGIGAFFEPKKAERYGIVESEHVLINNLRKLGISPEEIDYVILSHLHFDHAGGLLSTFCEGEELRLAFPHAKVLVGQAAWKRAQAPHPRDRASFIPYLNHLLQESGRLIVVNESPIPDALNERFEFFYTDGHTPGQMHSLIKGKNQQVFFAGDLFPGTSWLHLPVTMGYDRYPELLIDEKREILQKAIRDGWYMFYTHDPKVAISQVGISETGKFGSIASQESIVGWHC